MDTELLIRAGAGLSSVAALKQGVIGRMHTGGYTGNSSKVVQVDLPKWLLREKVADG